MTQIPEYPPRQRQARDDIGIFLAVCDAGSFAAAAPRLALTASAVAKAIGRLETRLGTRLFHRTTRRLALTGEAQAYRETCLAARQQIERMEAELASLHTEPSGLVRLSLPPLFGTRIVAPALYDLQRSWPRLRFAISTTTAMSDLPGEGIDLAVRIGDLLDLPDLTARRLGTQNVVLCGSRRYFARRPVPHEIGDLAVHELIAAASNGHPAPWHFQAENGENHTVQPAAKWLLDGSQLTLSAIRADMGLGLVPQWLARDDIASGELVPVLEDRVSGHLPVHALWITSTPILPRLRVTIDAIAHAARSAITDGLLA